LVLKGEIVDIKFNYVNNVTKETGQIELLLDLGFFWDYSLVKNYKLKPIFCIFFSFLWFTINIWFNNGQEIVD
jgi:hypothetical protein